MFHGSFRGHAVYYSCMNKMVYHSNMYFYCVDVIVILLRLVVFTCTTSSDPVSLSYSSSDISIMV